MLSRRRSIIALIVLPVVLLLSVVSLSVANATRQAHHNPSHHLATPTITIQAFTYKTPASVRHGATIKVINKDSVRHTVTSNTAGKFNVAVPAHSSRTFKAPVKGTYGFHCTLHPSMKGTLHVS